MEQDAIPAAPDWLTLGEASRLLGVDESTLRTWADAGRIPAYRTPGGHRRFARQAVVEFLEHSRRDVEPRLRDLIGPHADRLVPDVIERIRGQHWYQALDRASAKAIGLVCHDLMGALGDYLTGGPRRAASLLEGERAARQLGERVAGLRLSPADATEAFLFFKQIITDAVSTKLPLSPDRKVSSLLRVDAFLDRVLLQMMFAYEHSGADGLSP